MSEQGMTFENGNSIPPNEKTIALLDGLFAQLWGGL